MSAALSILFLNWNQTVKAEATVRSRVRGTIIRIRIPPARILTIIRISRQKQTPYYRHLFSRAVATAGCGDGEYGNFW